MNSVVACDQRVLNLLAMDNVYWGEAILGEMRTTGCASALSNWIRRVNGACSGGKYTVGPPTYVANYMAQIVLENAATKTPQFDGKTYSLKEGESCRAVALSQGIATTNLLYANGLNAFCANFPTTAGTQLCIQSEMTSAGAHWAQIVSWNPEVGQYCEEIDNLATGSSVLCVFSPGGDWVNSEPKQTPEETSTTEQYRSVPVHIGYEASYRCSDYAKFYGISVNSLVEWNPSLRGRLRDDGECYLRAGEPYCSQLGVDEGNKMTKYFTNTAVVESGKRRTCEDFLYWYGLT
ncbi:hypothetical protein HJFPF1_04262 [Paramyrothecium foliicola]|nr:hypothetical protein HJFPF1_04262 [Paramyrothecium foliicola]